MKNFSKILLAQVAQLAQTFRNPHQYWLTEFCTNGTNLAQMAQIFFENTTKADFVTPKVSLKALLLLRCATNATNAPNTINNPKKITLCQNTDTC